MNQNAVLVIWLSDKAMWYAYKWQIMKMIQDAIVEKEDYFCKERIKWWENPLEGKFKA